MFVQQQQQQQQQQHQSPIPVCKLKYFTPDVGKTHLRHDDSNEGDAGATARKSNSPKKKLTKSFLEPNESAFINIRSRLSTLSLNTAYKKGSDYQTLSPPMSDRRAPPRRISSISSKDAYDRSGGTGRPRVNSRSSFMSDDKEYRQARQTLNPILHRSRASETAALNKLNGNILTATQNPEFHTRQIKTIGENNDRDSYRSSSPRSVKSVDSSGKVHMGLIESLDLNENLNDLDKIKERYSKNEFMNSLSLYRQRGHDRCWNASGMSQHIPRGTTLSSPELFRSSSKISWESGYANNGVVSPRASLPAFPMTSKWEPQKSHVHNQLHAKSKPDSGKFSSISSRKKSVAFHSKHQEISEDELQSNPIPSPFKENKGLKSILKRANSELVSSAIYSKTQNGADENFANENFHWKYQLPKLDSPVNSLRKPHSPFKKALYQYGTGISSEFEQVISKYGNCRQNSMTRDSFSRENGSYNAREAAAPL